MDQTADLEQRDPAVENGARPAAAGADPRSVSGASVWPYTAPPSRPLPATLPGGTPWPRISIVTPSFNQGRFIEQTILSVINQGYPDVEHIIVDGGSTDETMRIVEGYRRRLAAVISEPDEGQSDAINKGMSLATGGILTWLNSDDMLAPGALAAAAMGLHTSGADMIAGECCVFRDGRLVHRHQTACGDGPLPLADLLDLDNCWLKGQFFFQPEVLFTRELWERTGAAVRTDAFYSMDYELWCRFALAGARMHVLGRPICWFRQHEEQKTALMEGGFKEELPKVRDAFCARHDLAAPPSGSPIKPRRDRLRVVLFNDIGFSFGAGIAHRRMARMLIEAGHEVHAVAASDAHDPGRHHEQPTTRQVIDAIGTHDPHLVLVGNIHSAGIDPGVLGLLAERWPTLVLMHDLWLLTGRCAYPGSCRSYLTGCSEACTCPPSHLELSGERIASHWRTKRTVLRQRRRPMILGNSRWTMERAAEALRGLADGGSAAPAMSWIKFGLELDEFIPRDRAMCREELGLPRDAFLMMTSASLIHDERKGLSHLAEALRILDLPDAAVVSPGHVTGEPPIPGMIAIGYIADRVQLAKLYSAVDVFVGPALEEAFGQVYIEAAACGTPSIAYPVGGVPEALANGINGLLATEAAPAALAEVIRTLYLDPGLRRDFGSWGRLWVENEWSFAASYHRFRGALAELGLTEELNLAPKSSFATAPPDPPDPQLVNPIIPGWRAVEGFGPWVRPDPAYRLPWGRWAFAPSATFTVEPARPGPHQVVISLINRVEGQRVRIRRGAEVLIDCPVPRRHERERVLSCALTLDAGPNALSLDAWAWNHKTPQKQAVYVTGVTVLVDAPPTQPSGAPAHSAGAGGTR